MSYWEDQKVQPDFKTWLETWHDSILCGCDHGCNGWLAENAGKALRIIELLQKGEAQNLDAVVQKHITEVNRSIFEDLYEEIVEERRKKDES